MAMLLRQCREIGIAMIIVDQHPHLISSAVLGNTFTTICLNQKNPVDLNKAAGLCLVADSERHHFSMLPVGQGIVKLQDRWRRPFLVQFPQVAIDKGLVTDSVLRRLVSGDLTLSALRRSLPARSVGEGRSRFSDKVLEAASVALLRDVLEETDDGVDARYKRLGWSAEKGNRVKRTLLSDGALQEQDVKVGRTRRRLLRVTTKARRELGLDSERVDRASIVHEYWKPRKRFEGPFVSKDPQLLRRHLAS